MMPRRARRQVLTLWAITPSRSQHAQKARAQAPIPKLYHSVTGAMMPRRARRQVLTLCYVTIAAALRPSLKTRPRTRLQAVASKDVEPLLLCKDIEAKVVENDKAILKGLD